MSERTAELVELDPQSLLVDINIRKDSKPDKDLVVSIKELGVVIAQS
jgi:hypothetical protein